MCGVVVEEEEEDAGTLAPAACACFSRLASPIAVRDADR